MFENWCSSEQLTVLNIKISACGDYTSHMEKDKLFKCLLNALDTAVVNAYISAEQQTFVVQK